MNRLDSITAFLAPRWTMRRVRARAALDLFTRGYEGATVGRRTQGWRLSSGDANAETSQGLSRLRQTARDLVRNNPYAESAVATIADHTVGYGIVAKPDKKTPKLIGQRFHDAWKAWAETSACDSEGRLDFAGIQKHCMRAVPESGEILIRRRWRRPDDNLPLPFQLQVLESDYLDSSKDGVTTPGGGTIVQGVEFDALGRRRAYWLFREHPGSQFAGLRSSGVGQSVPIPASEILHIGKAGRPGQVRYASWFAPVMLRLKDLDDYEDAALMKQRIAACLAVLTTDVDGNTTALGATSTEQPTWDYLEPGMISNVPAGKSVTVVQPPSVSEHDAFTKTMLRAIAAGLGVTFEDITGCYDNLPFSAARMSRLRHWARVDDWRWRMLIPQLCDPVWAWAVDAAMVAGIVGQRIEAEWTAPPPPMIEPDVEARAYLSRLRIGSITWPEMIRELGYDPEAVFAERQEWNKRFDAADDIVDGDARHTTQQGGPRETAASVWADTSAPPTAGSNGTARSNGNGHHPPVREMTAEEAFDGLARTLSRIVRPAEPPVINVDARTSVAEGAIQLPSMQALPDIRVENPVTFAEGAVRIDVAPPPPAAVTVEGPEIHVAPAEVKIAEGAVRVDVAAPPPQHVTVEAPNVTVEAPITVQPPEVRIEEGAVQVDVQAPTTIADGAVTPSVTVVRTPRRRRKGDG